MRQPTVTTQDEAQNRKWRKCAMCCFRCRCLAHWAQLSRAGCAYILNAFIFWNRMQVCHFLLSSLWRDLSVTLCRHASRRISPCRFHTGEDLENLCRCFLSLIACVTGGGGACSNVTKLPAFFCFCEGKQGSSCSRRPCRLKNEIDVGLFSCKFAGNLVTLKISKKKKTRLTILIKEI